MGITATRYHDISCGHRVHNHKSKCAHLHGHNYRFHFTVEAENGLDSIGRVLDFSVIKERLCVWLESNWDHKFVAWDQDPVIQGIASALHESSRNDSFGIFAQSIVRVPFNPTAENMAKYLVEVIGPEQLEGTGARLIQIRIDETAKCSATFSI